MAHLDTCEEHGDAILVYSGRLCPACDKIADLKNELADTQKKLADAERDLERAE